MAIHSQRSKSIIRNGVEKREDFELNGSLSGRDYGNRPYSGNDRAQGASYVVRSYAEPIAWFKDGQWFETSNKWSQTTTNHQSNVRYALTITGQDYVTV